MTGYFYDALYTDDNCVYLCTHLYIYTQGCERICNMYKNEEQVVKPLEMMLIDLNLSVSRNNNVKLNLSVKRKILKIACTQN